MVAIVLAPGTLVTPKVRLVERIGSGGMGIVWAAEHLALGTQVAVKFIAPGRLERDPTLAERFRREAGIAAQLTSPHAVKVFDHGAMDDGTPYIVMERLAGESLAVLLAREGRVALRKAATIVSQLCGVLGNAHALEVVHRDVKAENVFLLAAEYDVFVKLLDFGVAKQACSEPAPIATQTGALLGTPHAMAPEQLLDAKEVDHRADLWAVGVVAYQAITGRKPFQGATIASLSVAICNGEFEAPSHVASGIGAELDAWFARALSVTPEDRFDSAKDMADALVRALDAAPAVGDEPPPPVAKLRAGDTDLATTAPEAGTMPRGDRQPSTLEGAASTVRLGTPPPRSRRMLWLTLAAGTAAAAGIVALGRDRAEPTRAAPALASELVPVRATATAPLADPSSPSSAPSIATSAAHTAVRAAQPAVVATAPPSASSRPKPAYCSGDEAFSLDERGHLRVRPECL